MNCLSDTMYSWDIDDEEEEEEKDVKYGGANLTVFLIEATSRMKVKVGEEGLDCVQTALGCAHATIKDKILTGPRDCVAVVTFGNPAKKTKESEFETVRQIIPLTMPSSENILRLEEYTDCEDGVIKFNEDYGYGDESGVRLHEALWHCQTLVSGYKGKVASRTVILMTNCDKPHTDSRLNTQAQKRSTDLHNSKINLEVIPVCDDPSTFSMKYFYQVINNQVCSPLHKIFQLNSRISSRCLMTLRPSASLMSPTSPAWWSREQAARGHMASICLTLAEAQ